MYTFKKNYVHIIYKIEKVQCVYDSKLIALKMNTNKSKGRANINKEINRLTSLSMFSNVWALLSFQVNHIRHICIRHHSLNPEHKKDFTPHLMGKLTME